MTAHEYLQLRQQIIEAGYSHEVDWAKNIRPPETALALWHEYAWVVLNSGMREQIARKIWEKIRPVIEQGGDPTSLFGHKQKLKAITEFYHNREIQFKTMKAFGNEGQMWAWIDGLPFCGPITRWHMAKNLGFNVAKPDRHLVRIAGEEGTHSLCDRLSKATGDTVATVDLVIWRAANLGLV